MKHLIVIALLLTGLNLQGQIDSIIYDLPDVILEENRLDIPFRESSRSINVITASQIKALPVQSVNELLAYVGGVDIRQRGAHGVQADVGIRGGTFDQTLVLINGVKITDPQTGHHLLNLPIDIENIERIEVLKGPGARIFGQNAFAGAINIITKNPEDRFVKVRLQGGENTLGGARFSVSFPTGDLKQYFSVAKDFSNGYRYNTDYDISNYFYQNTYQKGNHKLSLMAGYTDRRFGANGFYASPEFTDQYEEVETSLLSLGYTWKKGNWELNPRFSWRRNQDEYIFVRNNPSIYRNLHIGNVVAMEVHARNNNKLGQTGIGVEVSKVSLRSTNLGDRERLLSSFFLEHRFRFLNDHVDLIPGVAVHQYSDFGTRVFPGLDAGLLLGENLRVYGNVGYTYRIPTFTDLYYEDPANLGNPDLEPEEAVTYEFGGKVNLEGMNIQASYFNREGNDLIDWTKEADSLQWMPVNLNVLITRGADLTAEAFFPVLLGKKTRLQRLRLAYTYVDAQLEKNDAVFSRYALENLQHQVIGGIEYRIAGNIYHSILFRYLDRVNLEDYSLVDTKLFYQKDNFQAFVDVTNLFDVEYRETNLVLMPGRWVKAGVSFKLGL